MPKQEKVEALQVIKDNLDGSAGLVLAHFKGMSVASMETLRKKVIKDGGTAKVVKNTLLRKALEEQNIKGMDEYLKESTILFSSKEDILKVLKSLGDYTKVDEKFVLKAGMVDGQLYDKAGIMEMSKLPTRKDLLSMIVGNMNGVLSTFLATIEALEEKKSKEL